MIASPFSEGIAESFQFDAVSKATVPVASSVGTCGMIVRVPSEYEMLGLETTSPFAS